ncbi:MAG TPA: LacI family DNA-binding transcriptional regulator [Terriglobales bacterium]|nr:LacI family DNA-binding transcriptional regulator [Terriglobales bacterium]
MSNTTTMKQIAERAQVSLGTVSHVLNGTAPVRERRRARVLEAIHALGYRPSELARGLRLKSTSMLGMVIPDITNPFFPGIVRGVEDVAFKESFRVVLCNTDNDAVKEKAYLDQLQSYHPAGLLLIPAENNPPAPTTVPVVFIDRCPTDWAGDAVMVGNEEGAFQATEHLLKLGHTRLAAIGGPSHLSNAAERLAGFRNALAEQGLEVEPDFIQVAQFDRDSGYRCGLRLLNMLPRPTAIFASNDLIALGVLLAVRECGLRCPNDISIIGFDNLDLGMFTNPALSSVHQPGYQMGARAARLILERIKGKRVRPQHIVLPTELRLRDSVAPPPGR